MTVTSTKTRSDQENDLASPIMDSLPEDQPQKISSSDHDCDFEDELEEIICEPLMEQKNMAARRVVASFSQNSQECQELFYMLGIFPHQITE